MGKHLSINIKQIFKVFTSYLFIAILSVEIFTVHKSDFMSAIVLISLAVLLGLLWSNKKDLRSQSFKKWDWVSLGLWTLYFCSIFILEAHTRVLWLDEYTQFFPEVFEAATKSIGTIASTQQQPPIDYYLSSFSRLCFGISSLSARSHALIFGWLSGIIAYLVALSFSRSRIIGNLSLIYIAFTNIFMFYFTEARPISLTVMLSIFSTYFTILYFRLPSWENRLYLFASYLLLLFTTNLQSHIFIASIAITALVFYSIKPIKNRSIHLFLGTVFVAIVVHLPIFLYLFFSAVYQGKFHNSTENEASIFEAITNFSFIEPLFNLNKTWVMLVLVAGAFCVYIAKAKGRMPQVKCLLLPFLSTIFVAAIFMIMFSITFNGIINWGHFPRYNIILYTLPPIALSLLIPALRKALPQRARKPILAIIAAFALIATAHEHTFPRNKNTKIFDRDFQPDWIQLYDEILSDPIESKSAYLFSFHNLGEWRPDIWVSKELYVPEQSFNLFPKWNFDFGENSIAIPALSQLATREIFSDKIYLVLIEHRSNKNIIEFILENQDFYQAKKVDKFLVISFFENTHKKIQSFLDRIARKFSPKESTHIALEFLIANSFYQGNRELNKVYLEAYQNLVPENKKGVSGSSFKKSLILKQRFEYIVKRYKL